MRRVRLKPFEDQPEQFATIADDDWVAQSSIPSENQLVIVFLDEEYRENKFDDGLREVPLDQVEIL